MSPMNRRNILGLLGGATAWPLAARAQQSGGMRRIGVLMNGSASDPERQSWVAAFRQGLQTLGWTEGQNIRIDLRWNEADPNRTRAYVTELVGLKPDVILAPSSTNLTAMLRETRTIPIVFTQVSDPVVQGFVTTLARPGGNVTGFTNFESAMAGKWLDLLRQVAPGIGRVTLLFNPATSPQSKLFLSSIQASGPSFGVQVTNVAFRERAEIVPAIEHLATQPNSGLIFPTDSFVSTNHKLIVEVVARTRLPAIYANREIVANGGLMFYGTNYVDQYRQAAGYVDRILKGARAGDLPVQQPTKFEFVVNMKTAKALGLEIPSKLLFTADEVIE